MKSLGRKARIAKGSKESEEREETEKDALEDLLIGRRARKSDKTFEQKKLNEE